MTVEIIPRDTVIARRKCSACGGPVAVKVSKSQTAYYFCGNIDQEGDHCAHHEKWNKRATARMVAAFVDSEMAAPPTPPKPEPQPDEGNDDGPFYL